MIRCRHTVARARHNNSCSSRRPIIWHVNIISPVQFLTLTTQHPPCLNVIRHQHNPQKHTPPHHLLVRIEGPTDRARPTCNELAYLINSQASLSRSKTPRPCWLGLRGTMPTDQPTDISTSRTQFNGGKRKAACCIYLWPVVFSKPRNHSNVQ